MSAAGDALRASGAAVESKFANQPVGSTQKNCRPKSWIDFRLLDANGKPISGMRYRLDDTEGRTVEGVTDFDGCAGEGGIDPGNCQITFLGYEGQ